MHAEIMYSVWTSLGVLTGPCRIERFLERVSSSVDPLIVEIFEKHCAQCFENFQQHKDNSG